MAMIENHYYMDITYKRFHFARVEFAPLMKEEQVKLRAQQIGSALMQTHGDGSSWAFRLMWVECKAIEVDVD